MTKPCIDGQLVPARCWYYVLEWKDTHYTDFCDLIGKDSLQDLTREEFWKVFNYASSSEEGHNLINGY